MFEDLGREFGNGVGRCGLRSGNGCIHRDLAGGNVGRDRVICLTWLQYDWSGGSANCGKQRGGDSGGKVSFGYTFECEKLAVEFVQKDGCTGGIGGVECTFRFDESGRERVMDIERDWARDIDVREGIMVRAGGCASC